MCKDDKNIGVVQSCHPTEEAISRTSNQPGRETSTSPQTPLKCRTTSLVPKLSHNSRLCDSGIMDKHQYKLLFFYLPSYKKIIQEDLGHDCAESCGNLHFRIILNDILLCTLVENTTM